MAPYKPYKKPMTKGQAKNRIAAAIKKKRMTNKPVKFNYFRRSVNKASNYSAITTLAKQVKELQFARNGFKQWQHVHQQQLPIYPAGVPEDVKVRTMRPLQERPYAFMVNDFTPLSPIFYGTAAPGAPSIPTYGQAGEFIVLTNNGPYEQNYNWNVKQSQETALNTHYLPIKSTMRFELQCLSMGPTETPITVRFTMLKLKNNGGASIIASLPSTLGAYRNLVDFEPTTRNHFNTSFYHQILSDKWVTFNQTDVTKNNLRKVVTMVYNNYSTKPLNPDLSIDPTGQKPFTTIPKKDQVWMVISTDSTDSARFQIRTEKWNTWRDAAGIGN